MVVLDTKADTADDVDVVYVGGWGRSGSTLLTRILAEADNFVSGGEMRDIFLRGPVENRVCGCGERFSNCDFWQAVGDEAYGGWDQLSVARLKELRSLTDKPWHVPALMRPGLRAVTDDAVLEYGQLLLPLYRAIRKITGARYIVDASKIASYAAILQRVEGLSPRVIHLVRDPRGTLHSWMKQVRMTDDLDKARYMPQYNLASGAARYVGYNAEMHAVGSSSPYLFMRYEDLILKPETTIRDTLTFLGAPSTSDMSGFLRNDSVNLGTNHTLAGNPMRHKSGWIELKSDDSWRRDMPKHKQLAITSLTLPLLKKYEYSLRPAG